MSFYDHWCDVGRGGTVGRDVYKLAATKPASLIPITGMGSPLPCFKPTLFPLVKTVQISVFDKNDWTGHVAN